MCFSGVLSLYLSSCCSPSASPAVVSFAPEFFQHGPWEDCFRSTHPELQRLASMVPAVALADRASSTIKKYSGALGRYADWASHYDLPILPVRPADLVLYMMHLLQSAHTVSPIVSAMSAINWAHEKAGFDPVTSSPIVSQVYLGCQRLLATPASKKQPLSPDMVMSLVDQFLTPDVDLDTLQTLTLIVVGFSSFLRWDELHQIRIHQITFTSTHANIFVPRRKNDQLREGHEVLIARSPSEYCPVSLLSRFIRQGRHSETQFLFGKISRGSQSPDQILNTPMSYSRALEKVRLLLQGIGQDPARFGLHSLRSGGASAAAVAGVPDRLFKLHGGWRSDAAKDGYVEDSTEHRLLVSQSLGL